MISNLISLFISSRLQPQPIYEALAVQDGIHLPTAETRQRHGQRQVVRIMRPATALLPAEITVGEALERARSTEFQTWLVTDRRGVVGVINLPTIEREVGTGAAKLLRAVILFSATPMLRLPLSEIRQGLAEGGRGYAGTLWRRFGANLVVVELAVAVGLLVGAGLLGKRFYRLLHVDVGFQTDKYSQKGVRNRTGDFG